MEHYKLGFPILMVVITLSHLGCATESQITSKANFPQDLSSIAVVDFSDAPGAEAGHSGEVVADALTREFMRIPNLAVTEREKLRAILSERALNNSDLTNESDVITEVGELIGADAVAVGAVSQYDTSTIPIFLGLVTHYKDIYKVAAGFRIVSVDTGEVLLSGDCSAQSGKSYQEAASKLAAEIITQIEIENIFMN